MLHPSSSLTAGGILVDRWYFSLGVKEGLLCLLAGAFGLPKLKESSKTRPFEDFDNGIYFEIPVAWVK